MALHLHLASDLDRHVDAWVDVAAAKGSPFERVGVVVPGRGFARWLGLSLASRLGVWANPWFPTVRALTRELCGALLGDPHAQLDEESLVFRVAASLSELSGEPGFEDVHAFLAGDADGSRELGLATRLAWLFARYRANRPHWIESWRRGEGDHWQARVFAHATRDAAPDALGGRALIDALEAAAERPPGVPARLGVMGFGRLATPELDLFGALARHADVHVFLLTPEPGRGLALDAPSGTLPASLTRPQREGFALLRAAAAGAIEHRHADAPPSGDTALGRLRAHVRGEPAPAAPVTLPRGDDSIRVVSCHGAMREVEVLRSEILLRLARDPSLEPRDVLVLCPDMETYGPLVDAAFGRAEPREIPFRVLDRRARARMVVVDALLSIFDLLPSRMTASAVLDVLARDPVRERFGIDEDDLDAVRDLVAEARIRWGVDEAHRTAEGQPALREHTWRFGLDRLLLGVAMRPVLGGLFAGVRPHDDVEGDRAELVGRLGAFAEALFAVRERALAAQPVAAWVSVCEQLLTSLIGGGQALASQHQRVRDALGELAAEADRAGFTRDVTPTAFRRHLERRLDAHVPARDFVTGGITFAAFRADRCVPARVVALLGMNDRVVPRADVPLSFDLMAKDRAPGDPSARDDDRSTLLFALLAARDALVVTHTGQDLASNAARPPSVLVSELCDALDRLVSFDGERARDEVSVVHPLHAFSHRYFDGTEPRLSSFDEHLAEGARASLSPRAAEAAFVRAPLAPRPPAGPLALDDLVRFFEHPAREFMRGLGVSLADDDDALDDREPIALDGLESWALGTELLELVRAGVGPAEALAYVRAGGGLPPGIAGESVFQELFAEARLFVALAGRHGAGREGFRRIDVEAGGRRVVGVVRPTGPDGHLDVRFSRFGGKVLVAAWVRHLALNVQGGPVDTVVVCRGVGRSEDGGPAEPRAVRLRPVTDAAVRLAELVRLREIGLRVPLPAFPRAAFAAARRLHARRDDFEVERVAREEYRGSEKSNVYVAAVYGERDPFELAFRYLPGPIAMADGTTHPVPTHRDLLEAIYVPLLDHEGPAR